MSLRWNAGGRISAPPLHHLRSRNLLNRPPPRPPHDPFQFAASNAWLALSILSNKIRFQLPVCPSLANLTFWLKRRVVGAR